MKNIKADKLKIFAEDIGLAKEIRELVSYSRYINGFYSITKKGKLKDKEKYQPLYDKLTAEIEVRLRFIFGDFMDNVSWSAGKTSSCNHTDSIYYVTLFNPGAY